MMDVKSCDQPGPGDPIAGGRFRFVRYLGGGSFGKIYEVFDERDPAVIRKVAIKIIRYCEDKEERRNRNEMLSREFHIGSKIRHHHVCEVHELIEHDGNNILVLEHVDGEDCAKQLRRMDRFEEEKAIHFGIQVARGLDAFHEAGFLHGDVKPANIMISPEGDARVVDFGAAVGVEMLANSGSPMYMSPERLSCDFHDVKSEIYSFGLLLYELVVGVSFVGKIVIDKRDTDRSVKKKILQRQMEIREQGIDWNQCKDVCCGLKRIISICVDFELGVRPDSMMDVAHELESLIDPPWEAEPGAEVPGSAGLVLEEKIEQTEYGGIWIAWDKDLRESRFAKICTSIDDISWLKSEFDRYVEFRKHQRVVSAVAHVRYRSFNRFPYFIVIEQPSGVSMLELFEHSGGFMNWSVDKILGLFREIVRCVSILHIVNMRHLGLSPRNVYVDDRESAPVVRLLDCGSDFVRGGRRWSSAGMSMFCSPECQAVSESFGEPSFSSDVYSLGMILLWMIRGRSEVSRADLEEISDGDISVLLTKMLHYYPDRRHRDAVELLAAVSEISGRLQADREARISSAELRKCFLSSDLGDGPAMEAPREKRLRLSVWVALIVSLIATIILLLLFVDIRDDRDYDLEAIDFIRLMIDCGCTYSGVEDKVCVVEFLNNIYSSLENEESEFDSNKKAEILFELGLRNFALGLHTEARSAFSEALPELDAEERSLAVILLSKAELIDRGGGCRECILDSISVPSGVSKSSWDRKMVDDCDQVLRAGELWRNGEFGDSLRCLRGARECRLSEDVRTDATSDAISVQIHIELGSCYRELEEFALAKQHFEAARLELITRVKAGGGRLGIMDCVDGLGRFNSERGWSERATLFERSQYLEILLNLGICEYSLGNAYRLEPSGRKRSRSERILIGAYEGSRRMFGDDHWLAVLAERELGVLFGQGRDQELVE